MRNPLFIAQHRGGPLTVAKHRLLARWAARCAARVVKLFKVAAVDADDRPAQALVIARRWAEGGCTTGAAMKAAVAAHAAAREVGGLKKYEWRRERSRPSAGAKSAGDDRVRGAKSAASAKRAEAQAKRGKQGAGADQAARQAAVFAARAAGHAVATAHFASHCIGASFYARKAVAAAGGSVEAERKWQVKRLPAAVRKMVMEEEARRFEGSRGTG